MQANTHDSEKLTPQWAGTFLGLLEVLLIAVPLIFYRYGVQIRNKSRVIRQMREEQAKNESRRVRQQARLARKAERRAAADAAGLEDGGLFENEKAVADAKALGTGIQEINAKHSGNPERDLEKASKDEGQP